jgi:hypothetical protein
MGTTGRLMPVFCSLRNSVPSARGAGFFITVAIASMPGGRGALAAERSLYGAAVPITRRVRSINRTRA